MRHRPYVTHEAKAASLSLVHEITQIWSTELAAAATHPFRETKSLQADPSMMYMLVHFVIERWREALLWSWVVGKHGSLDDQWTDRIMRNAWQELGGNVDEVEVEGAKIQVTASHRSSMDQERVSEQLRESGYQQDDGTSYQFCETCQ